MTSRVTCSSTPPSLTPGASSVPSSSIVDLGLDRDVELDLLEVEVDQVALDRMALLLLDHDGRGAGAVELEVDQRAAVGERRARVALGDLEGSRVLAAPVDDARDHARTAQAATRARTEVGAIGDLEGGAGRRPFRGLRIEKGAVPG